MLDLQLMSGAVRAVPSKENLLVLLKGNVSDETLRADGYKHPGDFPMELKQSFSLDANGVDDSGITSIAHGTLVSSGGTSSVTYSGSTLTMTAGTLWRLEFSDGTVYALAEGSGPTCFSTDGLHTIALTSGNLTALRSGRQDSYHRNVVSGFSKRENGLKFSEKFDEWDNLYADVVDEDGYFSFTHTAVTAGMGPRRSDCIYSYRPGNLYVKWTLRNVSVSNESFWFYVYNNTTATFLHKVSSNLAIPISDTFDTYVGEIDTAKISDGDSIRVWLITRIDSPVGESFYVKDVQLAHGDNADDIIYQKTEDFTLNGTEYLPFLTDNNGNIWNGAETKQSFKQTQVATFDGVSDSIDHGSRLDTGNYIDVEFDMELLSSGFRQVACGQKYNDWEINVTNLSGLGTAAIVFYGDGVSQHGVTLAYPSGDITGTGMHHYRFIADKTTGVCTMWQDDYAPVIDSNDPQPGIGTENFNVGCRSPSSTYANVKLSNLTVKDIDGNTLFDAALDEGSGADIRNVAGDIVGTVTSSNLTDFWANKVTPQKLLDADATYELFTDAATKDVKSLTQDEISAGCNTNDQYFEKTCENKNTEFTIYDQVLTGDDLVKAMIYNCIITQLVDSDGNILTDSDNETLFGEA